MSVIDVKDVVGHWLQRNGYEGLCTKGCGCEIDDLMPCQSWVGDCNPGYKVPCDPDTCEADGDCDWHIATRKEGM